MAPASLLAVSRLDFQRTTPLDVYVGEVIYCKYISEKLYITKYSTFYDYLDTHFQITYTYIAHMYLMYLVW